MKSKNLLIVALGLLCAVLTSTMGCSRVESSPQKQDAAPKTDQSQKVTQSDPESGNNVRVTFIELGSERCIPCIKMQAVMKEIQERYGEQVRIVFYDVWTPEGEPYARQYNIRVIPTQVFLDDKGQEYFRHEGYFPLSEVTKVLTLKGVR